MWTPDKSTILSSICTKIVIGLVIICAVTASGLVDTYIGYTGKSPEIARPLLYTLYACCVPCIGALFCLDRLLANIKKGQVFIEGNVKYLRRISWCSFAAGAIMLAAGFYYLFFIIVGIAALFFGLVLRVVKNVIQQAIAIKAENDYTI